MENNETPASEEAVPATDGRRRNPKTGTFTHHRAASERWKYRHSANLSPSAFLCFLKVQLLLREMEVEFEVSASTTMEFMYAVMQNYHNRTRLDLRTWEPMTRQQRPRIRKKGGPLRAIKQIADAEIGGAEYIRKRIEKIEHDFRIVRESRSDRAKRIPRNRDLSPGKGQ